MTSTCPGSLMDHLGYDERWAAAFDQALDVRLSGLSPQPARIVRTDRGACELLGQDGSLRASWGADIVAAVARDPVAVPSTGDWAVALLWPDGRRTVEAVLPRRTVLVRAQVNGSSNVQVLAANAEVVAVVEGLVPDPDLGRIERLLALAEHSGAAPRLVLTKADLIVDGAALAREVVAGVGSSCPVDVTTAPDAAGLSGLRARLVAGDTIALVGASGVGKSTLVNALVGEAAMATRSLGTAHKGRHTTVTRELHLVAGGGCLIDTPGLRSVGLVAADGLDGVFADIDALALACRFTDCGHGAEPGCAVRDAIENGELAPRRLRNWDALQREARWQAARTDARLRREQQRVWKQRSRASRQRRGRA